MPEITDAVILGSGLRGLWLSGQLVDLGWKVKWIEILPKSTCKLDDFIYDDLPWQVGPAYRQSKLVQKVNSFVDSVIRPQSQEVAVQVLTKSGPLEMSGSASHRSLIKFFGQDALKIEELLNTIPNHDKRLLNFHAKKVFTLPSSRRWILEWIGGLRRPRLVTSKEWFSELGGEYLDPKQEYWVITDSSKEILERGIQWALNCGVEIKRGATLIDVGIQKRKITGVEISGGQGFIHCRHTIFSCSQKVLKTINPALNLDEEKLIWVRCGFKVKKSLRPTGLMDFSSYVLDPHMPLTGSNFGLLKWNSKFSESDTLTVWLRLPREELGRPGRTRILTQEIVENLKTFFPYFERDLVVAISIDDFPQITSDNLGIVYAKSAVPNGKTRKFPNLWLAGPEFDRGFELLSQLATENRTLETLEQVKAKEQRRDRALHSPRNGRDMVNA